MTIDTPTVEIEEKLPPKAVQVILRSWHKIECWIAVACFSFIAGILLLDVLGREVLGPTLRLLGFEPGAMGIFTARKLAVLALVVGSYMGIGIATATGSHLIPRVGHAFVPRRWDPFMDRLADILTGSFLIGMAWYGWIFVQSSQMYDLRIAMLGWPVWPVQLAIPLGFLSAAGRYYFFAAWPAVKPKPSETKE